MPSKAVFVDRDGTLNEMVYDDTHGVLDSPRRAEQVRVIPGAGAFLRHLKEMGNLIVVITNQPAIAKGTLTEEELAAVNHQLACQLEAEGGRWDAMRYCPHHPEQHAGGRAAFTKVCSCRKPKPGLILQACEEFDIDPASSWMVGDGLVDVQAGNAAGCRTLLLCKIKLNVVERFLRMDSAEPNIIAADFEEALQAIRNLSVSG